MAIGAHHYVGLFSGVAVYFASSLGGIALVKLLNYRYCFVSWWTLALLSRSTWVLSLVLHTVVQKREGIKLPVSFLQLRLYGGIAIGLAIVELFNSLSMSMLPGSLYMLLKGSDVGWSMALSSFLLKKTYSRYHILAAMLIMGGISLVFVLDRNDRYDTQVDASFPVSMAWASILCLCGALLNALCSVGTELTLKETLKDEQNRLLEQNSTTLASPPSKLLLSNAYSMWTSFFSFILLIIPLLVWGGIDMDKSQTEFTCARSKNEQEDHDDYYSNSGASKVGICLVFLGMSRFLERLSKHFICVCDSAMTFSIVQAARRLSGVYIIGLLFGENFPMGLLVGSLCSGTGFALHTWASMMTAGGTSEKEPHNYKKVASTIMDLTVEDHTAIDTNTPVEIEMRQSLSHG